MNFIESIGSSLQNNIPRSGRHYEKTAQSGTDFHSLVNEQIQAYQDNNQSWQQKDAAQRETSNAEENTQTVSEQHYSEKRINEKKAEYSAEKNSSETAKNKEPVSRDKERTENDAEVNKKNKNNTEQNKLNTITELIKNIKESISKDGKLTAELKEKISAIMEKLKNKKFNFASSLNDKLKDFFKKLQPGLKNNFNWQEKADKLLKQLHKKANNNKQTTQNIEQNDKTYHAEKNREMKSSKNNAAHNTKQNKIAQNNSGLGAKNKNNVKVILNDKIVSLQQNKNLAQFTKIHDLNHTQTNTHKLIEKVIQSIKYAVSENTKELNIRLKPDHLGRINIKLKMEDNIMNGKLIVDNNAVKELLESKMQFLKDHLKDQGYNFANIDVDISSEQNSDQQKSMFNIENEKHNSSPGVDLKEKEAADNRLIDLRYNEKQLNLTA